MPDNTITFFIDKLLAFVFFLYYLRIIQALSYIRIPKEYKVSRDYTFKDIKGSKDH